MHDLALLVGRLLMGALFLPSGIRKAMTYSAFASQLGERGLPFPELWAIAAIVIEVVAPLALIIGVFPRATALALIAFVVMATATSHRFWEFAEPQRRFQEISFYKNVGILGGLLFYFAAGPGGLSLNREARERRLEMA